MLFWMCAIQPCWILFGHEMMFQSMNVTAERIISVSTVITVLKFFCLFVFFILKLLWKWYLFPMFMYTQCTLPLIKCLQLDIQSEYVSMQFSRKKHYHFSPLLVHKSKQCPELDERFPILGTVNTKIILWQRSSLCESEYQKYRQNM